MVCTKDQDIAGVESETTIHTKGTPQMLIPSTWIGTYPQRSGDPVALSLIVTADGKVNYTETIYGSQTKYWGLIVMSSDVDQSVQLYGGTSDQALTDQKGPIVQYWAAIDKFNNLTNNSVLTNQTPRNLPPPTAPDIGNDRLRVGRWKGVVGSFNSNSELIVNALGTVQLRIPNSAWGDSVLQGQLDVNSATSTANQINVGLFEISGSPVTLSTQSTWKISYFVASDSFQIQEQDQTVPSGPYLMTRDADYTPPSGPDAPPSIGNTDVKVGRWYGIITLPTNQVVRGALILDRLGVVELFQPTSDYGSIVFAGDLPKDLSKSQSISLFRQRLDGTRDTQIAYTLTFLIPSDAFKLVDANVANPVYFIRDPTYVPPPAQVPSATPSRATPSPTPSPASSKGTLWTTRTKLIVITVTIIATLLWLMLVL
jgi:hypothetical protein